MYNSSKNWIRAGLLAMGLAVPFMVANAQAPFQEPVGTVQTCDANGVTDIIQGGYAASVPHNGFGTFQTVANFNTPTERTELQAIQVTGRGFDPVLGEVVWEADIPRTDAAGLRTTIEANQAAAPFPATGTFRFFATLRASSKPGVIYASQTPVEMTAQLTSWPHNGNLYNSIGPVTYENTTNPDDIVETPMMNATVTAQAAAAPFQQPVGTVRSCNASGFTLVQTPTGPANVPFTGGVGTFKTISNSNNPTPSTTLEAVSVTAVGNDPVLGTVTWAADIPRSIANNLVTTITSNQVAPPFPATGTFTFHATITLSSRPGVVFISQTPVVLTGTVTAWPHNLTNYTSTGPVVYENVDNPEEVLVTDVMNPTMTGVD